MGLYPKKTEIKHVFTLYAKNCCNKQNACELFPFLQVHL